VSMLRKWLINLHVLTLLDEEEESDEVMVRDIFVRGVTSRLDDVYFTFDTIPNLVIGMRRRETLTWLCGVQFFFSGWKCSLVRRWWINARWVVVV
jgi:hypothetical protein